MEAAHHQQAPTLLAMASRYVTASKKRAVYGERQTRVRLPWHSLLSLCRTDTVVSLLAQACERHSPTAEAVRQAVEQEPLCRQVLMKQIPPGVAAAELKETLESAFGKVLIIAIATSAASASRAGLTKAGLVVFATTGSAIKAVETPSIQVGGKQISFRWGDAATVARILGSPGVDKWTRRARRRHLPPSRRGELLVRELDPETSEMAIAAAFAHFGEIRRVYCPRNLSQKHRVAYVAFADPRDALRAAQQTQRLINGRLALVSLGGRRRQTPVGEPPKIEDVEETVTAEDQMPVGDSEMSPIVENSVEEEVLTAV